MNYEAEVRCIYEEEEYSVRNNGEVMRHSRDSKRRRGTASRKQHNH